MNKRQIYNSLTVHENSWTLKSEGFINFKTSLVIAPHPPSHPRASLWRTAYENCFVTHPLFNLSVLSKRFICCYKSFYSNRLEGKRIIYINSRYHFLMVEIPRLFLYCCIAFSIGSKMLLMLHKYLLSTLVQWFGTISMKNVLKMLAISYSFFINFSFLFNII